jgi:hypothetical protein
MSTTTRRPRSEFGRQAGRHYELFYDQAIRMTAQRGRSPRAWRWWLRIDGDWRGDYPTRREAMAALAEELDRDAGITNCPDGARSTT